MIVVAIAMSSIHYHLINILTLSSNSARDLDGSNQDQVAASCAGFITDDDVVIGGPHGAPSTSTSICPGIASTFSLIGYQHVPRSHDRSRGLRRWFNHITSLEAHRLP